jgi:hypothetical protein
MAKTQANQAPITGEYLYKQFVETSKHDVTQMTKVEACFDHMAYTDFSSACTDMVKVTEAKAPESLKSAKNTASVLRAIFGAYTFAKERFLKQYEPGKTGYHQAYAYAQAALKAQGVRANGNPILTDEQKQAKQAIKLENAAYKACAEETAREPGESLISWQGRVMNKVQDKLVALESEAHAERIGKLAEAVKKLCGNDLDDVLLALIEEAHGEVPDTISEDMIPPESRTGTQG